MSKLVLLLSVFFFAMQLSGQTYSGIVKDESGQLLSGVKVTFLQDKIEVSTNDQGEFSLQVADSSERTLVFEKVSYTIEQVAYQKPSTELEMFLRTSIESAASVRELGYIANGCGIDNPNNPDWNATFVHSELKGDLAPNSKYTRRDPSAVIQVGDLYYMWYSYSLTEGEGKNAPWDLNDIYYSTSTDGNTWEEKGAAVERGEEGSFDHRSVFTTEIFVNDTMYYLVYQAAATLQGIYDRNVVAMSYAKSPDGPWTKLDKPVLYPTYTNDIYFDNNAVHDPCIISYNGKFHLYYKGECNCLDNEGCSAWCNPVCGTNYGSTVKQVKWGVAIGDSPIGPFQKSASNPITNTGHEVMVWSYKTGIAILQHKDGAEANTIQYAEDGLNFEIQGTVSNMPEAAGLFRGPKSDDNPHAGISWGVGHVLKWDAGPNGWMYINRFELYKRNATGLNILLDTMEIQINTTRNLSAKVTPYGATNGTITWGAASSETTTITNGKVRGIKLGQTKIYASIAGTELIDSCIVIVNEVEFTENIVDIAAASFTATGGTFNDGKVPYGFNKSGTSINYVNKEDWGTYQINIPASGLYELRHFVSTPSDNAELSISADGMVLAKDFAPNSGGWDNYFALLSDSLIALQKGMVELKLVASGSNDWQWNMQKYQIKKVKTIADVPVELQQMKLNRDTLSLNLADTFQLKVSFLPEEAVDTVVYFSSSNKRVIGVDALGLIHASGVGEAYAIVMNTNETIGDSCMVTVLDTTTVAIKGDAFQGIIIHPNPVNEVLNITGIKGAYNLKIFALDGQPVLDKKLWGNSKVIMPDINSGIYVVIIQKDELKYTSEIIYRHRM